jgi:hypothetical protein
LESGPDTPAWLDHNYLYTTRSRCMPFTSSIVASLASSAFTARWCIDAGPQQAPQPSFTPRRSGVKRKIASCITMELVRMCACHELEQGTYREALLQTLSGCRSCVPGDRLTGLGRPVCDPSLGPGTGLAQCDRSQGLPACEEASATSAPPQHRRMGASSSPRVHPPCDRCEPFHKLALSWGSLRGAPLDHRQRDARWVQPGTARVSCLSILHGGPFTRVKSLAAL